MGIIDFFSTGLLAGLIAGGVLFLIYFLIRYISKERIARGILLQQLQGQLLPDFLNEGLSPEAEEWFNQKGKDIESFEKDILKSFALVLDSKIYHRLGVYNLWKDKNRAACDYFDRARKLEPENNEAIFGLATALVELGKYEQALLYYHQLIEKGFNLAACLYNKGWVLDELGKYDQAIDAYKKSYQHDPDRYWNKYNIACSLTKMHQFDKGIKTLQEVANKENVKEFAKNDPELQPLRDDERYGPKFHEFLKS